MAGTSSSNTEIMKLVDGFFERSRRVDGGLQSPLAARGTLLWE
jgi:hypothetical protein